MICFIINSADQDNIMINMYFQVSLLEHDPFYASSVPSFVNEVWTVWYCSYNSNKLQSVQKFSSLVWSYLSLYVFYIFLASCSV